MAGGVAGGTLWATSDLHVSYPENRQIVEGLRPASDADWLLIAGDVGELVADIEWTLRTLSERFATVIWVPGNHDLWTPRADEVRLKGVERYQHLVALCRSLGVLTPEDEFPLWTGAGGPAVVAPLFLLYDYSFRPPGTNSKAEALALAHETGIVCTDEHFLHPDPYATRDEWCHARVDVSLRRLDALDPELPKVLVNHYPLVRAPTDILYYPVFAQWCGTELTADWHRRYRTAAVVYGHLHIPRTTHYDDVRFEEVSVGYPREWRRHGMRRGPLRQILPAPRSGESQ